MIAEQKSKEVKSDEVRLSAWVSREMRRELKVLAALTEQNVDHHVQAAVSKYLSEQTVLSEGISK